MFPSIQPYPTKDSRTEPGPSQRGSPNGPRKRSKLVRLACNSCRNTKAKCDGGRPSCSSCLSRGRECTYEGKPGDTRHGAMKSRLAMFEKLVVTLKSSPRSEASNLLDRIRSTKDVASLVDDSETEIPSPSDDSASPWDVGRSRALQPRAVLTLPRLDIVQRAIEGFFNCSGKLFHVFSPDQVEYLWEQMMTRNGVVQRAAMSCVTATAAVGAQYWDTTIQQSVEEECYDMARHCFEMVLETSPLDAIKVCTLLAMYNIMNKTAVAVAWVEIGLSMSRRHGLHHQQPTAGIPEDSWADYRKSWRTLLFFSSWLATTVGYVSGNDPLSGRLPLSELVVDDATDIFDIVQAEMTKIAIFKADILRAHLVFNDLSLLAVESIMTDLRAWHSQIPQEMKLPNSQRDVEPNTWRSIYHVHLLYHGAVMLLFQRVLCQYYRMYGLEKEQEIPWKPLQKMSHIMEDGVRAARNTGIILTLLLSEGGIFKRFWLVIFHAYISATILLYAVAQKQLQNYDDISNQDNLIKAQQCLEVLEHCGSIDPVAHRFREVLVGSYNSLVNHNRSAPGSMPLSQGQMSDSGVQEIPTYLLAIPDNAQAEPLSTSLGLALLLCNPYANLSDGLTWKEDVEMHTETEPTRSEFARVTEKLEWQFENNRPFHWDQNVVDGQLRLSEFLKSNAPDGFLGRAEPSQRQRPWVQPRPDVLP